MKAVTSSVSAARLLVTGPGRMKPIRSVRFELVDPNLIGPGQSGPIAHNARDDAMALRATVLAYEYRMAADPGRPSG